MKFLQPFQRDNELLIKGSSLLYGSKSVKIIFERLEASNSQKKLKRHVSSLQCQHFYIRKELILIFFNIEIEKNIKLSFYNPPHLKIYYIPIEMYIYNYLLPTKFMTTHFPYIIQKFKKYILYF